MASNLLHAQWSESDVSALFDSGHVHTGNLRALVVHMRAHKTSIKADQTIYYFTRLRRDHIVLNGGEHGDTPGSSDSNAVSSSFSCMTAKERQKEDEMVSEHTKKSLLKDKPMVCAVFRYADNLLGRGEVAPAPSDRKPHTALRGSAASIKKIQVQGPSSGFLAASSSSSSVSVSHDGQVNAAAGSGSGSGSGSSSSSSNVTNIDPNRPCNNTSGYGSGSFTNGIEGNIDRSSSSAAVRNPKRAVPILSPLGVINENAPPVDMTHFLQRFLDRSEETSSKKPRPI